MKILVRRPFGCALTTGYAIICTVREIYIARESIERKLQEKHAKHAGTPKMEQDLMCSCTRYL